MPNQKQKQKATAESNNQQVNYPHLPYDDDEEPQEQKQARRVCNQLKITPKDTVHTFYTRFLQLANTRKIN
jgi:hypothetical protein